MNGFPEPATATTSDRSVGATGPPPQRTTVPSDFTAAGPVEIAITLDKPGGTLVKAELPQAVTVPSLLRAKQLLPTDVMATMFMASSAIFVVAGNEPKVAEVHAATFPTTIVAF